MDKGIKTFIRSLVPRQMLLRYRAALARRMASDADMVLLPLLANNGSFLDVGANLGTWSFNAAKYFKNVHAFEPDEQMAALLRNSLPSNAKIYAVALSDHEGFARFAVPVVNGEEWATRGSLEPGANAGYSEIARRVPITTLDSFVFRDVTLIKIDVEGHEGAVIDGAAETISRERPVLVVEIEERHHPHQSVAIFNQLLCQDYECMFIRRGRLEVFVPSKISELQSPATTSITGSKSANYVANFIFIPAEHINLSEAIKQSLEGQSRVPNPK